MIDLSLLRLLKTRENFDKLYTSIHIRALEKRTQILVADIAKYYEKFTTSNTIDYVTFKDMFFSHWHRGMDTETQEFYNKILDHAATELDPVATDVMTNALLELSLADSAMQVIEQYNAGKEISLINQLKTLVESAHEASNRKIIIEKTTLDLQDLFAPPKLQQGLHYRNTELDDCLYPAQFGDDFIVLAARPDQGKTTFILNEITHMASQVDDRPVLWLNNEGRRERIIKRAIQVTLGKTMSELVQLQDADKLLSAYETALKAPHDRIRVLNIHDYWTWQVEELIEAHKPKIVVFDMIDHIKFSDMSLKQGARTDQILEEMYKWARVLGVKHNLIPIATSQISVDGEGVPYPDKSMLANSRTGKQGAADTIIMLGHSNNPELANSRYISTPKTKAKKEGKNTPRKELIFDIDRGRFN